MLKLSLAVTNAVKNTPHYGTKIWLKGVHALYAAMGENCPDWQDGCRSLPNEGDLRSSESQWAINLAHMLDRGIQLRAGDDMSFWYLHRKTSSWASLGEHCVIELCYVDQCGDEFHGCATEYFPMWQAESAFAALRDRIQRDLRTKESSLGVSLETAIVLNTI